MGTTLSSDGGQQQDQQQQGEEASGVVVDVLNNTTDEVVAQIDADAAVDVDGDGNRDDTGHQDDKIVENSSSTDEYSKGSSPNTTTANRRRRSTMSPAEIPVWASPQVAEQTYQQQGNGNNAIDSSLIGSKIGNVDLLRMKNSVFFLYPDRNTRLSRFWILLILAAIIASSGVISDSAATVIGAMIVAPLMTPILGVMLSSVLTDGRNFLFSLMLLLTGIGTCILIGFILGFTVDEQVFTKDNNSQVAGRVAPKIPDLIGALATGMVGAIALVRTDIADALPGVAISISLVPPLTVVGLMLNAQQGQDALGALLLFLTNFMSIQVMGIFTMYLYGVHKMASHPRAKYTATMFLVMLLGLGLIAVPLYFASKRIAGEFEAESCLTGAVNAWAEPQGWTTSIAVARASDSSLQAQVVITGPPPFPNATDLDSEYINGACPTVQVLSVAFLPTYVVDVQS